MFVVMKIDPEQLLKYEREIKVEEYSNVCNVYIVNAYSITRSRNVSIQIQSVRFQTPPGLNPRLYMPHRDASLTIDVNMDTSIQLINVSTRT